MDMMTIFYCVVYFAAVAVICGLIVYVIYEVKDDLKD